MNNYLLAIGWWNLTGSIMMLGFLHEPFGQKVLNEWTKIFNTKFTLGYWGKLWCAWACGLNIFFGFVNIISVRWAMHEMKTFLIIFDLSAYILFLALLIWGYKAKRMGPGAYSAAIIFLFWIVWGVLVLV